MNFEIQCIVSCTQTLTSPCVSSPRLVRILVLAGRADGVLFPRLHKTQTLAANLRITQHYSNRILKTMILIDEFKKFR